jgi:hypothetical protein
LVAYSPPSRQLSIVEFLHGDGKLVFDHPLVQGPIIDAEAPRTIVLA